MAGKDAYPPFVFGQPRFNQVLDLAYIGGNFYETTFSPFPMDPFNISIPTHVFNRTITYIL